MPSLVGLVTYFHDELAQKSGTNHELSDGKGKDGERTTYQDMEAEDSVRYLSAYFLTSLSNMYAKIHVIYY